MLFSNDQIADYINQTFEPVWQSVRAVPTVTIDFGEGNVIKRTLHGNIATYVCNSQGEIYDILPGIYEADTYRQQLEQLYHLTEYVAQEESRQNTETQNVKTPLQNYHEQQVSMLLEGWPHLEFIKAPRVVFKAIIEEKTEWTLTFSTSQAVDALFTKSRDSDNIKNTSQPAAKELLKKDTVINESSRRLAIHQYLAAKSKLKPKQVEKWLYREVLHADLDDPYLGLGKVLFADYPFPQ